MMGSLDGARGIPYISLGPTPPGKILVWTMPDKLSYWFNRPAGVNALVKASPNKDFYASMALAPATLHTARRTKAHQTTAIPALWADVDFRHDVHKEPNLPPSAAAALETLKAMPDKPTLIIHSGHGLQAYWVLTTPWVFNAPMAGSQPIPSPNTGTIGYHWCSEPKAGAWTPPTT